MKYHLFFGCGLLLFLSGNCLLSQSLPGNTVSSPGTVARNTINIAISPDLINLATDWISAYEKLHPGVKFFISAADDSTINKAGSVCFLSTDRITDSSDWKICIGHTIIVPVLNAKNPMVSEIIDQGISAGDFTRLFSGSGKINWSDLIKGGHNKPVNHYIIDDAVIKRSLSDFLQTQPSSLNAQLIASDAEFVAQIRKDPYSIGFCRLSDVRVGGTNGIDENIRLLPIDRNGNGRMDYFENIFNSPDDLSRGAWIGKYPHALSAGIYALSQGKPADENTLEFLAWIMTDGGIYTVSNGYSDLISMEKQANLAVLSGTRVAEVTVKSPVSLSWSVTLVLAIVAGMIVLVFILLFSRSKSVAENKTHSQIPAFNESTVNSPLGLFYDKTHTWAFLEHNGMVRLGIDDFLLHVTGTITRITMKEPGESVRRGEKFLTVTKFGKQLSLYSPVSGIIKARNMKLNDNSSLVNNAPYTEGWVYLVEPKNWLREIQFMWMGDKRREWVKDEFARLRNFFDGILKAQHANHEYAILQDGGELRDNSLSDLGPEVWEEFQRKFIDPSR